MESNEPVLRDGFQIRSPRFTVPSNTVDMDFKTKRGLTICNLFINHKLTVQDIVRVLDDDYTHVVLTLLNSGIVRERRQEQDVLADRMERRRSKHSSPPSPKYPPRKHSQTGQKGKGS
jgi:hypothetical protein